MEGEVVKHGMKSLDGRSLKTNKETKNMAFGLGFLIFLFHIKVWEKEKKKILHSTYQTKCNNNKHNKPQILRPEIKQNTWLAQE